MFPQRIKSFRGHSRARVGHLNPPQRYPHDATQARTTGARLLSTRTRERFVERHECGGVTRTLFRKFKPHFLPSKTNVESEVVQCSLTLQGEAVQTFFNVNRYGQPAHGEDHNNIRTRNQLQFYDSPLYDIVLAVFPCANSLKSRCHYKGALPPLLLSLPFSLCKCALQKKPKL